MADRSPDALSRRDLLKLGATAAPLLSVTDLAAPRAADAQAPKRGGVFRLAGFDPPHFDPHQTPHWWTFIYLSLTHSSLMRHLLVSPSARVVSMWEPYVKNFAPNISLDYGGRLMIAWLDK